MPGFEGTWNDLALIGMDVRAGDWAGLPALSRRLFHGEPLTQVGAAAFDVAVLVSQAVDQTCRDAVLPLDNLEIISLSPLSTGTDLPAKVETLPAGPDPLAAALALAAARPNPVLLLDADAATGLVGAVVVCPWKWAVEHGLRTYAVVTGPARAFDLNPHTLGLVEIAGDAPSADLDRAFASTDGLTCAVDRALSGLSGLVKTAWCLYERLIPTASEPPMLSEDGAGLYVASEARAWFLEPGQTRRWAYLETSNAGLLLKEESHPEPAAWRAAEEEELRLFPLASSTSDGLLAGVAALQADAERGKALPSLAQRAFRDFTLEEGRGNFRAALLARTPAELAGECAFAGKGLPAALEKGVEWQTPQGSYAAAQPLGADGQVSFIYPGGFNSYVGLGRGLFHLFPHLLDRLQTYAADIGGLINEKKLYPRGRRPLTAADLDAAEQDLNRDPVALLISGSTLAVLYTHLLRETFGLQAGSAFGYSLGEISMMFAAGAWNQAEEITAALRASPLFRTRLAGPQLAVREFWSRTGVSADAAEGSVWSNHVVMTDEGRLRDALDAETGVYLTHINTPRQFVIGGDPAACRRVIDLLKCPSLQAPYDFALHCDAIRSEYDALVALHSWPVDADVPMTLYSAYDGLPMPLERVAAARRIAAGLCGNVDFPHLVRQVYDGGARIFVELGAGSNCGRWVDETLKGLPHAAFSINRKGADDYTSLLRLLARLACHRVNLNLQPLYR